MIRRYPILCSALGLLLWSSFPTDSFAQTDLKVVVGQRGSWNNIVAEAGVKKGFFAKRGLNVDILYASSGGETMQPVISGAADIAMNPGASQVLGAFARGAPVRIIGSSFVGYADYLWYVRGDSQIKSVKDFNGKSIAYGSTGSSSYVLNIMLAEQEKIQLKQVQTGTLPATFTMVQTGQVDIGWTGPPLFWSSVETGKIRIVATGDIIERFRNMSVRVLMANTDSLKNKGPAIQQYVQAVREVVTWLYSGDPEVLKLYAEFGNVEEKYAKVVFDYYKKEQMDVDRVVGLDIAMAEGVSAKLLPSPLSADQLKEAVVLQKPLQ